MKVVNKLRTASAHPFFSDWPCDVCCHFLIHFQQYPKLRTHLIFTLSSSDPEHWNWRGGGDQGSSRDHCLSDVELENTVHYESQARHNERKSQEEGLPSPCGWSRAASAAASLAVVENALPLTLHESGASLPLPLTEHRADRPEMCCFSDYR